MKKYFLAFLLALAAIPASAADNFKSYTVPVSQLWTNNWIGIHGGYAFNGDLANPFVGFGQDGWYGGLNMGTQRQYGNLVLGIELEGNYGNVKGNTSIGPVGIQHEIEAFGSLRARLGYTEGLWHFYGLGGLAMASTNASISAGPLGSSDSKTHWGWVAGLGLEYAMSQNWAVGAEYAFYKFGSENYGFAIAGPIGLVTPAEFEFHTVKAKASYRW